MSGVEDMSVALLDADILLYIASRGAEENIDWEDGTEPMCLANFEKAKTILKDTINAWHQMSGCKTYQIMLTDRENPCFRDAFYPIYKKHRSGERPEVYDKLTKWLKIYELFNWYIYPTLEADDVLGMVQTERNYYGHDTVIVSIDKDMLTIPGKHLNPNKDDGVIEIDEETANYNWMFQTLCGDRVDNYKGAPGIGAKRAEKMLLPVKHSLGQMWETVVDGFEDQFSKPTWQAKFLFDDPHHEALANARCARILRHGDYDMNTHEVNLWTPNQL